MSKRKWLLIGLVVLLGVCVAVISTYMRKPSEAVVNGEAIINIKEVEAEPEDVLVKYEGPVHHIFFHSLIVYPELAFDNDGQAAGYDLWMTTVSEFKAMLPELKEKGYILYDIENLVEFDENSKASLKEIYLPEGKIPLVLSIDDVSYYDYMKKDGFSRKLVFDENGEVANEVVTPEGDVIITREGDVMSILDEFVKENPDFSFRGAKGILALTGFQGVFGYRITDVTGEELTRQTEAATAIANKLKDTGWRFACHSYTHNQYFKKMTVTMQQLKYDNERWKKYIEPVLGKTNIYISPFGVRFKANDERYRYLVKEGFNIFCPVNRNAKIDLNEDNIIMNRINLDGYMMKNAKAFITEKYFDVKEVLDKSRS